MNCPSCQTANPDGAKFCFNCGAALALTCAHCGASLPAGAKFCANCGTKVGALPADRAGLDTPPPEAATRPAELPAGTRVAAGSVHPQGTSGQATVGQSSSMEGERRVVTMLFCDVKGSTAAASQLDPEDWAEIINGAFEHMIQPVYHYEGTVARLMGDGLLAFFGAPIAHEDDPQRAILAGLGIVEAIKLYRTQIRQRWGFDLDVRVGINTGLVVVAARSAPTFAWSTPPSAMPSTWPHAWSKPPKPARSRSPRRRTSWLRPCLISKPYTVLRSRAAPNRSPPTGC